MSHLFEFSTANQIVFGRGSINRLGDLVSANEQPILLITGKHNSNTNPVRDLLLERGISFQAEIVDGEPESLLVDRLARKSIKDGIKQVIAFGGGSVLDAGKAIAMLVANGGETLDYAEIIGKGEKITTASIPLIAIPTTAGTGSEVTKNAVIIIRDRNAKVSLRNPLMLPRVAIVDPELMCSVPADVTASTGMDALTQVMESYLSSRSNLIIDSLCAQAIPMAFSALPKVYQNGSDLDAREQMAYVSLIGGIALANAGLGAVHGFAAALGGLFKVPHGVICACFLPVVFEANYQALMSKNPKHPSLAKLQTIARWTGDARGDVSAAIDFLYDLRFQLDIPGMRKFGMDRTMAGEVAALTSRTSSMKGNPVELSNRELMEIYIKCV